MVLKPAEWTPLVALALARIIDEAGLPSGLLSVLHRPRFGASATRSCATPASAR